MKNFVIGLLTTAVTLVPGANAWWDTGTIIIAKIAEDILDKEAPKVKIEVEQWMSETFRHVALQTKIDYVEKSHKFLTSVILADKLSDRMPGMTFEETWHYVRFPYDPMNLTEVVAKALDVELEDLWRQKEADALAQENIVGALTALFEYL